LGAYSNSFSAMVPSHGVTQVKIVPSGNAPTQTVYEADAASNTLSGTAVIQQCPGAWGYSCMDGKDVGWIGDGSANFVTINNVNVASSGTYNMTIYAAVSGTRVFDVSVNGGAATQVSLTGTSFSIPSTSGMLVQLNAGSNSIQFSNPTTYAPDLDHIVISSPGAVSPGFNIAYPVQNVTIASPGQSGTASLALVPTGGFTGNVAITCTLPAAMTGASCTPANASLSDANTAVVSLAITTAPSSAAALHHRVQADDGTSVTLSKSLKAHPLRAKPSTSGVLCAILFPIPALLLIGPSLARKGSRRTKLSALLLLGLISSAVLQFSACKGGNVGKSVSSCAAVPGIPAGVEASSITSSSATLAWTTSSVSANCAVTGYSVYQDNILIATTTAPAYNVTGLSPATTYSFTVTASDSCGASAASSSANVTTASAASISTPPGTYEVTITASSGSITRNSRFQIVVE
jgi:hypothetical protein